jgi:hypothetical protein
MLVLSAIAVAPSSSIQLVYSQGPTMSQQQDANDRDEYSIHVDYSDLFTRASHLFCSLHSLIVLPYRP